MAELETKFIYQFVPATGQGIDIALLLLHGTGGNENDLLSLGKELLPGAAILSPRGRVMEQGMPRFFRRFAEGVFDLEDLKFRTHELYEFVSGALEHYHVRKNKIVAVGYSNGANIAASLLLLHPHLLSGAVLFRAMVPFQPDFAPDLSRVKVLLTSGTRDPIVDPDNVKTLQKLFVTFGADVDMHWHDGGHELGKDDVAVARSWLARTFAASVSG